MQHVLFWLNITAFAALGSALLLLVRDRVLARRKQQSSFGVFFTGFLAWTLIDTVDYFFVIYIDGTHSLSESRIEGVIILILSLVTLFAYCRTIEFRFSNRIARARYVLLVCALVLFATLGIVFIVMQKPLFETVLLLTFYSLIFFYSCYALLRIIRRKHRDGYMTALGIAGMLFYPALVVDFTLLHHNRAGTPYFPNDTFIVPLYGVALAIIATVQSFFNSGAIERPSIAVNDETAREYSLTGREHQVLEYVIQGYSSPMIASYLDISSRTVEHHTQSIFRKCGVKSRMELLIKFSARPDGNETNPV